MIGAMPVNILLACIYRERGIFTAVGLYRITFVLAQCVLAYYFIVTQKIDVPLALLDPFSDPLAAILSYLPYHQLPSVIVAVSLLGLIIVIGLDDAPITRGLIVACLAIIIGASIKEAHAWQVFLITAGLCLSASIVRDSHNMAYRDELTGLPHRRAMNEQFLSLGST
jgi:hypothetical protein